MIYACNLLLTPPYQYQYQILHLHIHMHMYTHRYLTPSESHLLVGLESGHVRILAQDSEYLRHRLHKRLEQTGFIIAPTEF